MDNLNTENLKLVEIFIKSTAPFFTLGLAHIIFKSQLKLNLSYFIYSALMAYVLNLFSIPVVGEWETIKVISLFAYSLSIAGLSMCVLFNYCFKHVSKHITRRST